MAFATKELAVKVDFHQGEGGVDIIIDCAATCTGTVGKAVFVGGGLKGANLETLKQALSDLVSKLNSREIQDAIDAQPTE